MFAACGTDSGNNEETKDTANNATTEGGNDETKPSEENGNNTEGKTLKVGMICIGDENDQGYTYNFYRAKDSVTEKMKFLQEQSNHQPEQKTPQQKKQNMEL